MTQKLQKKLEQISLKVHLLVLSKATKGPNKNSHFWACHNCYLQLTIDKNVQVLRFSKKASTYLLSFGIWRCLLMSDWHIETHLFSDVCCHFTESIHKLQLIILKACFYNVIHVSEGWKWYSKSNKLQVNPPLHWAIFTPNIGNFGWHWHCHGNLRLSLWRKYLSVS